MCCCGWPECADKTIVRPYTPISSETTRGYFDLLVKRYEEGNASKYVRGVTCRLRAWEGGATGLPLAAVAVTSAAVQVVTSLAARRVVCALVRLPPAPIWYRFIHNLKVGDTLDMKGPFQKLEYVANMKKAIGMVAGGTGIAPMYQVIRKILADPRDATGVCAVRLFLHSLLFWRESFALDFRWCSDRA